MSGEPKGADVVFEVVPGGPGVIAQGVFVEAEEQRRIDRIHEEAFARWSARASRLGR